MGEKSIAEMRHEVIDNTIQIEILFDEIMQIDMGFEIEPSPDGEEILNLEEIHKFHKYILNKFRLHSKFEYMNSILPQDKSKWPTDYGKKWKRFIEIRNKFAHTLAPKKPLKEAEEGTVGMLSSDFDYVTKRVEEWEKLYLEHTALYNEIHNFIYPLFYINIKLGEKK